MLSKVRFEAYPLVLWSLLITLASGSAVEPKTIYAFAIMLTPLALALSFFWPKRWEIIKWKQRNWAAIPIALMLIVSVVQTDWPLKISYLIAMPTLEEIASRVENGEHPKMPVQVGLLRIKGAEVYYNGITCLWTDLSPSGKDGFVKTPPDKLPFNLWSHKNLDNRWQFIAED